MLNPLKVERMSQKIAQWRLAQLVGVSQTEISHYEVGRRRCPANLRYKIAEILKVKVDKIFPEGDDEQNGRA